MRQNRAMRSHIKQAIEIVEESAYTDEELAQYDKFWDAIRVEQAFVDEAEVRYPKHIRTLFQRYAYAYVLPTLRLCYEGR